MTHIEVCPVGGWGEVGRNMTAVKVDDSVVIFDMGLHMPNYIKLTDAAIGEFSRHTEQSLKRAEAIPQDGIIREWRSKVKAIVVTHAHLDHIGAVPYMAGKYDCPIICSPFSAAILKTIMRDEKIIIPNKIIALKPGQSMPLANELKLEFCHITHSTPQTIIACLHTPKGVVMYANDYKLDLHPTLGKPANLDRLKKLGQQGVFALIQDCLYAAEQRKTPSEQVAKDMLREVLLEVDNKGKGLIVTTFASHIARLKSIADCGRLLKRRVVFMGRSVAKYCFAAKDASIIDLSKDAKILKYSRQTRHMLSEIQRRGKDKYLMVVSGHQGEPQSTLSKMLDGVYQWNFGSNDHVVFSSTIIPADINREQRAVMDAKLKKFGVRIFNDIHVSGHSSREDLRDMLEMVKPVHVLPTHGEDSMMNAFNALALEVGYKDGVSLHPLKNGERLVLK